MPAKIFKKGGKQSRFELKWRKYLVLSVYLQPEIRSNPYTKIIWRIL